MREGRPVSVGGLLPADEARHRQRRRVARMTRGGEAVEERGHAVGIAWHALHLQGTLAPVVPVSGGALQLTAANGFVDLEPARPCEGDRHGGLRIVVAGHAPGGAQELFVGSLQQRQAAGDRLARGRGSGRNGRGGYWL